jgi:hypothetical protein
LGVIKRKLVGEAVGGRKEGREEGRKGGRKMGTIKKNIIIIFLSGCMWARSWIIRVFI